jgi:cell division septal protein FtsQ
MKKKTNIDRKQKRYAKKILFFSLALFGAVTAVAVGTFGYFAYKANQPLFVSPLASLNFVRTSQENNRFETLKKELQKEQIAFTKIEKTNEASFLVELKQGGVVTFSSQKDIIAQIASLQFILSHLTMEGREFSKLDLRFEKPVIVFK